MACKEERNAELGIKSPFAKQLFQPRVPKWSLLTLTVLPCRSPRAAAPRRSGTSGAELLSLCSALGSLVGAVREQGVLICFVAKILIPLVGTKQFLFG